LIAILAVTVLTAHTPYGQWTFYRRRNLFIVASRTDAPAVELAQVLVKGLARELPESHARFTRATDTVRIASLLATGQLDVAIISRAEAASMLAGSGAFKGIGPMPLRLLTELGEHLLVTVLSFRERHAFLLARAIEHLRYSLPAAASSSQPRPIPEHPGAAAYYRGKIREMEQETLR
jgi:TRAP-type uncharacterized transport system substrate-binding protein